MVRRPKGRPENFPRAQPWYSIFLDRRFSHKCSPIEISHKVRGPTCKGSETLEIFLCGSTANVVCVYFYTFWAYYTQYLSWFRTAKTSLQPPLHHAMCSKSKRRACVLRTQVRFPTEWKRKTKPEFYLERFLWTVRMRRIRLEHFMVSFGCLLTFTLSSLYTNFQSFIHNPQRFCSSHVNNY